MKTYLYIVLSLLFTSLMPAQGYFQQFISYATSLDSSAKAAAVDSFMTYARAAGIPFIEDSTANFIYLGNSNSAAVAGDFNDWNTNAWPMTRLSQTNFWYRTETFEMDARLDYKFVLNGGIWILDPENPRTIEGGFGPNSELSMPLYIQPWEIIFHAGIPHGTLLNKNFSSSIMGSNYQVNIYLPPGYDSLSTETYPVAYFQDGSEYIGLGKAVNVIDNLLDSGKIQRLIAVFVKPNNRNNEYAGLLRNQYRSFFVNELVPFIDGQYKTQPDPNRRLIIGDSFGGNISALISYNHPEVFGLCGLHSAAFWPNNYEVYSLILSGPQKDIKWSSIWGTYEPIYPNLRTFRDHLIATGYELDWLERPEGHSWGLWRASIDNMLMYFFPENTTGISFQYNSAPAPDNFVLYQNYPNPFNPSTSIEFSLPENSFVKIEIFNSAGQKIETLLNNFSIGLHTISWKPDNLSAGVYFYRMQVFAAEGSKTHIETRKMILIK